MFYLKEGARLLRNFETYKPNLDLYSIWKPPWKEIRVCKMGGVFAPFVYCFQFWLKCLQNLIMLFVKDLTGLVIFQFVSIVKE